MIGMSVMSIRRKCDHDVRLDPANMCDDFSNDLFCICQIHVAIDVVQQTDFTQTEMFRRALQFRFTDARHTFEAGVGALALEPAAFPVRRAYEIGLYPFSCIACKG